MTNWISLGLTQTIPGDCGWIYNGCNELEKKIKPEKSVSVFLQFWRWWYWFLTVHSFLIFNATTNAFAKQDRKLSFQDKQSPFSVAVYYQYLGHQLKQIQKNLSLCSFLVFSKRLAHFQEHQLITSIFLLQTPSQMHCIISSY